MKVFEALGRFETVMAADGANQSEAFLAPRGGNAICRTTGLRPDTPSVILPLCIANFCKSVSERFNLIAVLHDIVSYSVPERVYAADATASQRCQWIGHVTPTALMAARKM